MTNVFDEAMQKEKDSYYEKAKELNDFMNSLFSSKEILKILQKYNIGMQRKLNSPLFYTSSKENLTETLDKNKKYFATKGENGYLDLFFLEKVGNTDSFLWKKNREKYYHNGTTAYESSFDNYEIKEISPNDEKQAFLSELSHQEMVNGGYIFDSKTRLLKPHIGVDIKRVTKESLENCVIEYFLKPFFDYSKK